MTDDKLHLAGEASVSGVPEPRAEALAVAAPADGRQQALEQRVAELQRELAQARGREASWHVERSRLLAALEEAELELADLPALRHEADTHRDAAYWLAVLKSSWSWRVTAPLRVLVSLARRLRPGRRSS